MSRIKILSEHLANQIAAGEVIERPASVVKELLENSIDAGARQVQIEIEGSGTKLIKVIDDGMGMDADDVLLCFERHATSKLDERTSDNNRLAAIRSLGFRGEAIPSIASVAKMSLTSRPQHASLGSRVEVRYGKILKIHEVGGNKGTVIEVRDLFGNMPARKKFLKTPRTELFHIEEIIKNYALAQYKLGIIFRVNKKTIMDFPVATDTLEQRVNTLYSKTSSVPLIPLHDPAGSAPAGSAISIKGFLLSPEQSFAASNKLRLFVNGRAVKNRMMAHAVSEGLSGFLMKGRTAAGVIFVTVPFDAVDVNVHPTKQEIRFQEPSRIHKIIVAAVRHAMENFQESSRQNLFGSNLQNKKARATQHFPTAKASAGAQKTYQLWNGPFESIGKKKSSQGPDAGHFTAASDDTAFEPADFRPDMSTAEPDAPFLPPPADEVPIPDSLTPIGQLMDLYLLCEARTDNESHLVVIDQHAVHERILFENLKKQYAARQMTSQSLLFPKMLELTPEYSAILKKNKEQIMQFGLVAEEFGGDSYIVKAVPAVISHLDPEEILAGILAEFVGPEYGQDKGRKHADARRVDDVLSLMACKAAIKAGQNLNTVEMKQLLKLMQESRAFTHCPHGRPVVRMFSASDIKKWFHRT